MTEDTVLRIGLVGAGFLAATRTRCYRKCGAPVRLAAVASARPERARAFAERHGIPAAAEDAAALLRRDDVDAVDLCVPNALHRPLAEAAAAAGKHVICTKPLAAWSGAAPEGPDDFRRMLDGVREDARAMLSAARSHGIRLCYGENWVYAPPLRRAAALAARAGGLVLAMQGWEAHRGSHAPYAKHWSEAGGGALLRLAAHPIGAMLWLKREEGRRLRRRPTRCIAVSAETADLAAAGAALTPGALRVETGWEGVENWGLAVLHFDDGTRGVAIGSDNLLGGMESRLELHGSNFHLKCSMSPHDLLRAYAPDTEVFGDSYLMEKTDTGAGWSTPLPDEDWSSGQLAMCAAFVEDLRAGRQPEADGELGATVAEVVYGAYVAAAEGRRHPLETGPS